MAVRGIKTQISHTLVGLTLSRRQLSLPCLVQYSGVNIGRPHFLQKKDTIIGRDPRAGIQINEQNVSRQHAQVFASVNYVTITDLGSVNGVYVNGKRIKGAVKLHDGDLVTLGAANFKFFKAGNIEQLFYDKMYRLATIDEKTGVFNDKYLRSVLETEIEVSRSFGTPLSMMIYDLDFFKKVNDTFGHGIGDAILKSTAYVASQTIRKNDILCRYGGEEFVVILRETDKKTAISLAERLCHAVAANPLDFEFKGKKVRCVQTISIGVAQCSAKAGTFKDLMKAADTKLYEAKKNGRNCVRA